MTNITADVSNLLINKHSSPPLSTNGVQVQARLDSFLVEAYKINRSIQSLLAYLRAIRQPYLSTEPQSKRTNTQKAYIDRASKSVLGFGEIPSRLTDGQREEIDSSTAALLRQVNSSIQNLSSAAALQHDTATKLLEKKYGKPNTFMWRWAAGDGDLPRRAGSKNDEHLHDEGEIKIRTQFREGVIWYLGRALANAVELQGNMVETRLDREREKRMSVLYDERNKSEGMQPHKLEEGGWKGKMHDTPALQEEMTLLDLESETSNGARSVGPPLTSELSAEQLHLFAEENNSLLNYYADTLSKVTQAEKSLMEISSLQQTLVSHLNIQGEMVGQLVEDASRTDDNLRKGNQELKKASERGSVAQGVFWTTVGLCSFLVVWDLIF